MKFTGERYMPSQQGRMFLEHYHRYAIVTDIVNGKIVLDAASGEGYGTAILAKSAKTIVGIDVSQEAVAYASQKYTAENLKFIACSAAQLDFPDQSFDVVVSFETIEHLMEQEEVIAEFFRVLRSDGILVISSPNRPVYTEECGGYNEFHAKELNFSEFDSLLSQKFECIKYYGQRLQIGSVIAPIAKWDNLTSYRGFIESDTSIEAGVDPILNPVYFLAVCSKSKELSPSLGASIFYPEKLDLLKEFLGYAEWARGVDLEIADRKYEIQIMRDIIDTTQSEINLLNQEIMRLKKESLAQINKGFLEVLGYFAAKIKIFIKPYCLRISPKIRSAFDGEWYLKNYPDVAASGINPLEHYLKNGSREGRFPNSEFDSGFYLTSNPDVAASGMNPLEHYLKYGRGEGRTSCAADYRRNYYGEIKRAQFDRPLSKQDCIEISKKISFPVEISPDVSIIIPVYGQCKFSLQCLYSIFINRPETSFEILLVDDCSPDFSGEILSQIGGVQYLKNDANQGFIRSCNAGASLARGRFLCFLNNDTYVLPGWLDELVHTFESLPGTGLVGSKLLYPDGNLQEAGGILWSDGSGWNFGRNQNPNLPLYNYAREVDYCSGASILLEADLFNQLGGFDEHYLPAYCEDSDLALKIRELGYRVIYQPFSEVVHFEGVTSGVDVGTGIKSYQINNSKKLFNRWEARLTSHQKPGHDPLKAKDRQATYRVLILEVVTPTPDNDAGSVTDINLMILLREMGFQITFIATDNFQYDLVYTSAMQRMGVEVLYRPYQSSVEEHLKEREDFYDLVFLFRPYVVNNYLGLVKKYCKKAKTLYYPHDLHHIRMLREAALLKSDRLKVEALKIKSLELDAINGVDMAIMVSDQEAELVRAEAPMANIKTFPLVLSVPGTKRKFEERRDIIFVGGFNHTPNIDAILYFVSEVMPLLRMRLPGVVLHIVGSNPTEAINKLETEDIVVHGYLKDLNSLLDGMRISIAPLRYGAGVKGKIGTSMAAGLPVVTSSIGAEGMHLEHLVNAMIADSPQEYVNALVQLYSDSEIWNKLSGNGIKFSEKNWGALAAYKNFSDILRGLDFMVPVEAKNLKLYQQ